MLAHCTLISFYLCMLCLDSVFVGGGGVIGLHFMKKCSANFVQGYASFTSYE